MSFLVERQFLLQGGTLCFAAHVKRQKELRLFQSQHGEGHKAPLHLARQNRVVTRLICAASEPSAIAGSVQVTISV
jgi:hypothetical protein